MASNVTRIDQAIVNGVERTARVLDDGTVQWNNRTNWKKGKWSALVDGDTFDWIGTADETDSDPEYLETEVEQLEADAATAGDDAVVQEEVLDGADNTTLEPSDDATPTDDVQSAEAEFTHLVSAYGARGIALLFAGETPDSKVPYLGFKSLDDVDAFLATNLRSAWSASVKDPSIWKRRGVQLLRVHLNDNARTVVREYDPRPVVEDETVEA